MTFTQEQVAAAKKPAIETLQKMLKDEFNFVGHVGAGIGLNDKKELDLALRVQSQKPPKTKVAQKMTVRINEEVQKILPGSKPDIKYMSYARLF